MEINKVSVVALRNLQCWSQEDLAAAAGVSVRTVQRMESEGVSSLETVKGVAAAFNVDVGKICKPEWEWRHVSYFLKPFWKYYFIGIAIAILGVAIMFQWNISEPTAAYWAGVILATHIWLYLFECHNLYQKEFGNY